MKAIVIGGGLGGLAAAVALRKVGWDVDVLERAPEFGEVGAGIGMMPNALRALDELGLGAEVRRLGTPRVAGGIRAADGRWLAKLPAVGQEEIVAIHRADLHRTLLEALPAKCLHNNVKATLQDGVDADLVVAADGIRSGIRAQLFPHFPEPVYAGATAWRGVAPGPFEDLEIAQTLGPGGECGVLPLGDGRVCWYVSTVAPPNADLDPFELFEKWHDPIPRLMAATENILRHDIFELAAPLPTYVRGKVALLGDAAHAMTPYLGQGACMALEDAVVLASCVADDELPSALARYDQARRPRTQRIARAARQIGRFGLELRNPVAVGMRDFVFRALPSNIALRGMTRFSAWQAPRLHPIGSNPSVT
ncbi:FAD-dependent oxidoreductase [Lentzea sp. NBRC 105346]|uniref:FAD-dependent monooxygenase n=1 Tax=Lentzea sp. NBRC 105346 TaxID=3032205 RepID=UPI002552ED44|nr:FAD-dependent monooxygenase [Lentzea sp. NBRC 105346]GLZ33906.1 FAD-dependent oxidoreductase [Lentzea sp. NBRC 105346]